MDGSLPSSFFDDEFAAVLSSSQIKRPEATFVMDLLPGVVGWIIGRSGTRIKEIQIQSGCKMVSIVFTAYYLLTPSSGWTRTFPTINRGSYTSTAAHRALNAP